MGKGRPVNRIAFAATAVAGLVALSGPVLAHDPSGSREENDPEPRSCSAPADNRYDPPSGKDLEECKTNGEFDGSKSYSARYFDNEVTCAGNDVFFLGKVYADPTNGDAVFCDDGKGTTGAVQGRVIVKATPQGARVTADGDASNPKPNENKALHGWATVSAGPGGVTVVCGNEHEQGGKAASDHPDSGDNQTECGS